MSDTTQRMIRRFKQTLDSTKVLIAALLLLLAASPSHAETYFYHTDHLGTPQVLTNKNQTVVWQAALEPFGEVTEAVALVEQNLRFPGQYLDRESGLHYNYFRSYNPSIGRYTQSDPIGLWGGRSTYGYVSQMPITYIDIYGLEKINLFTTGFFTPDKVTYQNAQLFPDRADTLFIFGHGNPQEIQDDRKGFFNRISLDASELAEMIKKSGLWQQGMPIEIWGCATGGGNQNDSLAQKLADALSTEVKAFTENISIYSLKPQFSSQMTTFKPK